MKIKKLSDVTINRIAAGEVVERPASALKELVENSIDAGASKIEVKIERGGKNLLLIKDNGSGMARDDLLLAVERHTTSKLNESDIMDIKNFGFRGEALPSIAAVSRMKIETYDKNTGKAWQLRIEGGEQYDIEPSNIDLGTQIAVSDLFFATPARLKFLKSERAEISACVDVINKLALSYPHIGFKLNSDGKELIKYRASESKNNLDQERIKQVLGNDFIENATQIDYARDNCYVQGYVSLPTYNKSTAQQQYMFVNNRPVKDKLLIAAIKVAYQDFLARDRHPVLIIFVNLPTREVDVNVHPAKTEIRFQDSNLIRGLIISAIKDGLYKTAHQASTSTAKKAFNYIQKTNYNLAEKKPSGFNYQSANNSFRPAQNYFKPNLASANQQQSSFDNSVVSQQVSDLPLKNNEYEVKQEIIHKHLEQDYPLGAAVAQLHETYIVSQAKDSIIITDQHAAHERLTYEQIKKNIAANGISKQRLLIPEIIENKDLEIIELFLTHQKKLNNLGLVFEIIEQNIIVNEIPAMFEKINIANLIDDIGNNLKEMSEEFTLAELIEHITETYACHHSIRAGRSMKIEEMNEMLRQMEKTPFSGQCNHGRPTYVKLQLKDIEKLFGRR